MSTSYDFIVVGGGPAGCTVARRLADTAKKPSVLLLEAGGDHRDNEVYRSAESRFSLAFTEPKLDWGYNTVPQVNLNQRQVNHARGKGLGGSTTTNFSAWIVGCDQDFNEWANITGDSAWSWPAVQRRFEKIERLHRDTSPESLRCVEPFTHSTTGNVDLMYANVWDPNIEEPSFESAKQMGWPFNHDINSGRPLGIALTPATFRDGKRISSAEAYLSNVPSNLTIMSNTAVNKILLENKRATGVLTASGEEYHANLDVIMSAGSLNTPQTLMLSGIGPSDELTKHSIPVIHELPGVGKHLLDHLFAPLVQVLTPEAASNSIPPGTDPRYQVGSMITAGFLKLPNLPSTPEFQSLSPTVQKTLNLPTKPHFEFACVGVPIATPSEEDTQPPNHIPLSPTAKFRSHVVFLMNLQSTGTVTLSSSSPTDPPRIDSAYLSHPYDRRAAIDSLREVLKWSLLPPFSSTIGRRLVYPKSDSDEDLLDHWRNYAGSVWHMAGTVKMGKSDDDDDDRSVCVTPDFRVKGIQGLRVVDMSVAPLLPCNHTQSTAYLIGETAAEKLSLEYRLDHV